MGYFRPKMSVLIFWKNNRNSEATIRLLVFTFGILVVGAVFIIWMLVGGAANVNWWKTLGYPGVFILSLLASGGIGYGGQGAFINRRFCKRARGWNAMG